MCVNKKKSINKLPLSKKKKKKFLILRNSHEAVNGKRENVVTMLQSSIQTTKDNKSYTSFSSGITYSHFKVSTL